MVAAVITTVARWFGNLGGIVAVLIALGLPVAPSEMLLVAATYNVLAVIPLHSVGGIGITDAGLAALLVFLGVGLPTAAAASLLMRAVVLVVPPVFWALVMLLTSGVPTGAQRTADA